MIWHVLSCEVDVDTMQAEIDDIIGRAEQLANCHLQCLQVDGEE